MARLTIAPTYSIEHVEIERPSPLSDNCLEQTIQDILHGYWDTFDISDKIYSDFKTECHNFIFNSQLNTLTGIEHFPHIDIINGCTQYIDSIYMQGPVQTIVGDYRYHERLQNKLSNQIPGQLIENVPLIIAMPFPSLGKCHNNMKDILDEAYEKHIEVHVDGAWLSCCRDIVFDFNHSAIKSVGISLSKGLGLGWNRIGLRYTRQRPVNSVTIMNDFRMNIRVASKVGLHFLHSYDSDYLWNTHGDNYYKVCRDFNLTPTNSIYLALKDNQPVGISPLIRYLENHGIN